MTLPAPRTGWPLLPMPDAAGRLRWPTLSESIQQTIRVLLQTQPGEQLMRPTFGGGLQQFVGQPDTVATRRALQQRVKEVLGRHETRIQVEAVDTLDDPGRPGWIRLEIRFRIRRTGEPGRLGLSLALEGG